MPRHPAVVVLWTLGALALGVTTLGLVGFALPSRVAACGGFMCVSFSQPITQTGENIVFSVEDDGSIEAHVQVFYQGPADEFAWIVPTPSLPTLAVGTDALFAQLELATAPRFQTVGTQTGTCRAEPECRFESGIAPPSARDMGRSFSDAASGPVDVAFRGNVGPYDAAVLSATDSAALYAWLDEYDYLIPDEARPEIDAYVARGSYFVALRLQKDRAVGEIQPIVLRYASGEPCIPIRLTRIATVDDLPVRAYFLASSGFRSTNYTMLTPDFDDDAGLFLGSRTYESLVTNAVDDAGGRAFVTDYLGAPPTLSLELRSIEALRATTDLRAFLAQLLGLGFTADTQLLALLTRVIPLPDGVEPTSFFNCLISPRCPSDVGVLAALGFRPSELVDAINAAIIAPRTHAQRVVERHATLTRLYTTMSAADMTEDPVFYPSPGARPVSNVHTATRVTECAPAYRLQDAPQKLVLPSGRETVTRVGIVFRDTDESICRASGMELARRGCSTSPGTPSGVATALSFGAMSLGALALRVSLRRAAARRAQRRSAPPPRCS